MQQERDAKTIFIEYMEEVLHIDNMPDSDFDAHDFIWAARHQMKLEAQDIKTMFETPHRIRTIVQGLGFTGETWRLSTMQDPKIDFTTSIYVLTFGRQSKSKGDWLFPYHDDIFIKREAFRLYDAESEDSTDYELLCRWEIIPPGKVKLETELARKERAELLAQLYLQEDFKPGFHAWVYEFSGLVRQALSKVQKVKK